MIQERRRIAENVTASTSSTALQKTGTIGVSGISSILQYAPIELAALHAGASSLSFPFLPVALLIFFLYPMPF
jgi:hypothetical protein